MSPLYWAVLLLLFGLGLIVLEMFVPSGGVIGFISIASVVTSIIMAFRYSQYTGLGFMAAAVLGTPLLVALMFKWWPNTPLGRRILLNVPNGDDVLPDADLRKQMKTLIGKVGAAKTMMLPGGPVVVEGHAYDAVSEGMAIQAGDAVQVVEVRGLRIVVRPADPAALKPKNPDDPLNQSIDQLGLDPYEDPLK
jgi:membrane-bound ClpP family serine protease